MSFKKGDKVKYKTGLGPEGTSANVYVVLEYFLNYVKQPTVRVKNYDTNEELYKDPDDLEIVK